MRLSKPLLLASLSSLLVAGFCVWGWVLHPEHAGRFAFRHVLSTGPLGVHRDPDGVGGLLAAIGARDLALAQVRVRVGRLDHRRGGGLSGGHLGRCARRGMGTGGVLFGAGMAIWGNYLPKTLSPWNVEEAPFDWQRVHRFGGWTFSIGGVALVLVWLTLPLEGARSAAVGITATVGLLAVGRKFISVAAYSGRQPPARLSTTSQG